MAKPVSDLQKIYDQFKGSLRIDRNKLDEELETHSEIFNEVAEAHARSMSLRDEAKIASDEQYANSANKVRKELEDAGVKFSETMVKDNTATDGDYLNSLATYYDAKAMCDMLAGLRDAFEQRGRMIQHLGSLYISGYYTVNRINGTQASLANKNADIARAAMAEARKPVFKKR